MMNVTIVSTQTTRFRRNWLPVRRGNASIEFAMALPAIVLLLVGIIWLGNVMLVQAEVRIQARQSAWKQRFQSAAEPLVYSTDSRYQANQDFAVGEATQPVTISSFYQVEPPHQQERISAGSWDHRVTKLDSFPNWNLYQRVTLQIGQRGFRP